MSNNLTLYVVNECSDFAAFLLSSPQENPCPSWISQTDMRALHQGCIFSEIFFLWQREIYNNLVRSDVVSDQEDFCILFRGCRLDSSSEGSRKGFRLRSGHLTGREVRSPLALRCLLHRRAQLGRKAACGQYSLASFGF